MNRLHRTWRRYAALLLLLGVPGTVLGQTPQSSGSDPGQVIDVGALVPAAPCASGDCTVQFPNCDTNPCDCCVPAPCWTFSAGLIVLHRSNPDDDPLYQDAVDPVLGSDYDLGWKTGYELELAVHHVSEQDAIVARFFTVDGWSGEAHHVIPGNTQINSNPSIPMIGPRSVVSQLNSDLDSFELNYVWQSKVHPAMRWLVGFRTIEIDETLNTSLTYPPGGFPTVYHTVATSNRFYGAQTGLDADFFTGSQFNLSGMLSTGIYGGTAHQRSAVWDDVTPPAFAIDRDSTASLIAETGLRASYVLTPGITLSADYRALWVTGAALANEQVQVTNFTAGSGIDNDSAVFFHGFFVGFDWMF